ncbi:MAG: cytochrome c [Hydrogenophilales bacterium]|nr:cytochrome c [Hydrogenophilales bacterium]
MKQIAMVMAAALLVGACGKKEPEAPPAKDQADRLSSTESLFRGVRLYHEHCAQCHGPEAQGHPDWRNPQVAAAPPLNGTGNEWKRRKQDMLAIIHIGAKRNGEPVMPAWNGRLSDQDIEDIIAWFQALWPPDVYDRWRKANAQSTLPKG